MRNAIFTPVQIGGLTLKNRIVFAPTSIGLPPEERLAFYRRVARSGVGLIIVGDVSAAPSPHSLTLASPEGNRYFRTLTETVHAEGGKVSAQLFHPDYDTAEMVRLMRAGALSHAQISAWMTESVHPYVTGMTGERIAEIIALFAKAAREAQDAGFDMIQIHGDRLAGSFSSELYNSRTDEYGGSPENRARFAAELTAAVRDAVNLPIDYKLAVRQENPHYGNAGVPVEELGVFVPALEHAGANSFHVTLANHGKLEDTIPPRNHPAFHEEGCFLRFADEVKRYTALPVCTVGQLSSPAFAENLLANGRADLTAFSRQLIADPEWLQKVAEGRENEIRACLFCNQSCVGALKKHTPFGCVLDGTPQA